MDLDLDLDLGLDLESMAGTSDPRSKINALLKPMRITSIQTCFPLFHMPCCHAALKPFERKSKVQANLMFFFFESRIAYPETTRKKEKRSARYASLSKKAQ
jgi:hypothetical protein